MHRISPTPDARPPWPPRERSVAFPIEAHDEEKTWLLGTLGTLLVAITAVVIWQQHHVLVATWVIAAIAIPWLALSVVLRIKQDTLGFEGKYVDWWSIPHCIGGALFGLIGVPLGFAIAIATTWELVEIFAHTREYPTNRITDVVLAALGWLGATALAGGSLPLL